MHLLVLTRRGAKLQKLCLEVRSLNITWRPHLYMHGAKLLGIVRKECRISHAKFGGAARRRFYAT